MTAQPEFSRLVPIERIGRGGERLTIQATAAERALLARRFGLMTLDGLRAEIELHPVEGKRVFRLTADLDAAVVQSCVVSLEPVAQRIRDRQSQLFAVLDVAMEADGDEEVIEPIVDGQIDVGEAVAQQLALALPAYPRAPTTTIVAVLGALPDGVTLCAEEENRPSVGAGALPAESGAGAFAALARLKRG
jgi:uncharacterized metal-binding protein YceD (DUF177 family)